jgi:membrane protein DedA with SNARE-associated domain
MDISHYLNPQTIASLQTWGYIVMLALMIIEWPLVTFAGAFLASLGVFDIYIVFILGWIGDILGDLLFYSIGRYGLNLFKSKTTIDSPKEKSLIHKLDHLIHTNLALAILIIKFTPYAPPIGLTYIGKIGIPIRKYITASALLCIPIPLVTSLVGFHVGYIDTLFSRYTGAELISYITISTLSITLAVLLFFYLQKKSASILATEQPSEQRIEKNAKTGEQASR